MLLCVAGAYDPPVCGYHHPPTPPRRGFTPGTPVFLCPQKPTFPNSNSTWKARSPLIEFLELFGAPSVSKLHLHFFFTFTSTGSRIAGLVDCPALNPY